MLRNIVACAVRACMQHSQGPWAGHGRSFALGTQLDSSSLPLTAVRQMASSTRRQAAAAQAQGQAPAHLLPRVAIVGRPNVGKSALFNRLLRRRAALVLNTPGTHVTRDWREGTARLGDLVFTVADTSGLEPHAKEATITGRTAQLTRRMLQSAHVALLVVDAKSGVVAPDEDLARWMTAAFPRPDRVVVVANKAEGSRAREGMDQTVADCYRLGFGEPVAVSATTGDGMTDLYTALQPHVDEVLAELEAQHGLGKDHTMQAAGSTHEAASRTSTAVRQADGVESDSETDAAASQSSSDESHGDATGVGQLGAPGNPPIRMAIMGLPNAGKSTLVNALLGEERVLTGPEPGLTRDSVSVGVAWRGVRVDLVDTAGYIGQTKAAAYDDVGGDVAEAARGSGLRALASTHVVVLVLDAAEAKRSRVVLRARELALVSAAAAEGKAVVVAANKMDVLGAGGERDAYLTTLRTRLEEQMQGVGSPVLVELSALEGKGLDTLMSAAVDACNAWNARVSTGRLNRLVRDLASGSGGKDGGGGSAELQRLKYLTQVGVRPPTFLAFLTGQHPVTESFPRYVTTAMRERLGLAGTPLRFRFRYKASRQEERSLRAAARRLVLSSTTAHDGMRKRMSAAALMAARAKQAAREYKGLAEADGGDDQDREDELGPEVDVEQERPMRFKAGKQDTGKQDRRGLQSESEPRSVSEQMREAAAVRTSGAAERASPTTEPASTSRQVAGARAGDAVRGSRRAVIAAAASKGRSSGGRAALMAQYLQRVARSPTAPLVHVQASSRKARKQKQRPGAPT